MEELEANQIYLLSIVEQMANHIGFMPHIMPEEDIQKKAQSMRTIEEEKSDSTSVNGMTLGRTPSLRKSISHIESGEGKMLKHN